MSGMSELVGNTATNQIHRLKAHKRSYFFARPNKIIKLTEFGVLFLKRQEEY